MNYLAGWSKISNLWSSILHLFHFLEMNYLMLSEEFFFFCMLKCCFSIFFHFCLNFPAFISSANLIYTFFILNILLLIAILYTSVDYSVFFLLFFAFFSFHLVSVSSFSAFFYAKNEKKKSYLIRENVI